MLLFIAMQDMRHWRSKVGKDCSSLLVKEALHIQMITINFGHLSCTPVVNVTHYKLQLNINRLVLGRCHVFPVANDYDG